MKIWLTRALCLALGLTFVGCSEDSDDNTGSNSSQSQTDDRCQCEDIGCENCAVTTKTCKEGKLVTNKSIKGVYNGSLTSENRSTTNKCPEGSTCVTKSDTDAECQSSSNGDDSGSQTDKCQCEDAKCMNCATITKTCVNGMSIGRINTITLIDGIYGSIIIQNKIEKDEECPQKCAEPEPGQAICL